MHRVDEGIDPYKFVPLAIPHIPDTAPMKTSWACAAPRAPLEGRPARVLPRRALSRFAARVDADIDPYGRFSSSKVLRW